MSSIDFSQNTRLKEIDIFKCGTTKINVSKNALLKRLCCDYNKLSGSLDISNNTQLEELFCEGNWDLSAIKLGKNNTKLKHIQCGKTSIKNLDVSMLPNIESVVFLGDYIKAPKQAKLSFYAAYSFWEGYKSSDTSIAYFDSHLDLICKKPGTVTVTYNDDDDQKYTTKVTFVSP